MKRITLIGGMILAIAFSSSQILAQANSKLAPGETEVVYTFENDPPLYASPEGVAVDWMGNIYVSRRTLDATTYAFVKNEIVKLTPWNELSVVADLGPVDPGQLGALGLTTDWCGNVYAAFNSNDERHGVWKIRPYGGARHLRGSELIETPNSLTFDWRGNLYVTDSSYGVVNRTDPGLVWKYGKWSRKFEIWASSVDLAPDPLAEPLSPSPDQLVPGPGANGIAYAKRHIYVANTEKSLILDIPIKRNGSAGEIKIIAGEYDLEDPPMGPSGLLFAPDGLSVDVKGNLYTVIPPSTAVPILSPVIKIHAKTGIVEPLVIPTGVPSADFDFPTSLAFGSWGRDKKNLYVVGITARIYGFPGPGPKITKVGTGIPGRFGQ